MKTNYFKQLVTLAIILILSVNVQAQWTQIGQDIDGEDEGDYAGFSKISADGNTVIIGAYKNNGNGIEAGHVRIYRDSNGVWVQKGQDIDGEKAGDISGSSLSVNSDGNIVAIGAIGNDGSSEENSYSGHVRIYDYNGTAWEQIGEDIDGEVDGGFFGSSVCLSSDGYTVAIGAMMNNANGTNAGHAKIYQYSSGNWTQKGQDIEGEAAYDHCGGTVCLSSDGNIVAIGAAKNEGNGPDSGHLRIYNYNGIAWVQMGEDIDGESDYNLLSHANSVSLSLSGDTVAIGALTNSGNGRDAGHVRIFYYNDTAWVQLGLDIDGEQDDFAGIVSMSVDGRTVAIGAWRNDKNGIDAGLVRIFHYNGISWIQIGKDIEGESAGDESGWVVSISSDGNKVAIGATKNNGNGEDAGHVRIYQYNTTLSTDKQ